VAKSVALRHLLCCLPLFVTLTACPGGARDRDAPKGPGPCAKFGDSCEFSPGKLGSCVVRDGCTGADCFVCQSQH